VPRPKAFTCKRCGTRYVTARCPQCYPGKGKRSKRRKRSTVGRSGKKFRAERVLWGEFEALPVNPDATPERVSDAHG
jgi:hypothetical protein